MQDFKKRTIKKILEDSEKWFKIELEDGTEVSTQQQYISDCKDQFKEGAEVEISINGKYFNVPKKGGGGRKGGGRFNLGFEQKKTALEQAVASINRVSENDQTVVKSDSVIALAKKYEEYLKS